MKRKIIQIANSTQLVSLPKKWCVKYGVKKGDEIDIEEQGSKIVVSTEKGTDLGRIEVDITDLDRTTALFFIRSLYRNGYDEISVRFKEPYLVHLRTDEKKNTISVIHEIVDRLTGFEIIDQKMNYCIIKEMSEVSQKEFDSALRRVFLLLVDINRDLLDGALNNNKSLLESIENKHNSVMKFVSYCLRILNKKGYPQPIKTPTIYHIVANLDKIVDVIKYAARYLFEENIELSKLSKSYLKSIHSSVDDYYDFFYNFDIKKAAIMYEKRDNILKQLRNDLTKIPQKELMYTIKLTEMLELINDVIDARMSFEY